MDGGTGGIYVYGIVRARRTPPAGLLGVGAPPAPVRVLCEGPLAAVVSDAPARLRARRRDLMAHQELLLALVRDGAVLPMRFGMVAPDEEAVRRQLAAGREARLRALDRLAERVEMNVKALAASDELAALVAQEPRVRQLRDGARRRPGYEANLRLGQAVADALTRRAAEAAERVVRELGGLADATVPGPQVAGCVANTSFLLGRGQAEHFRAAADRLAAVYRDRVELRLAGPLPCYSFVEQHTVPAVGAWG